ncbi:hypothetical protein PR048_007780 [Dryococelus australis]|uniref:Uncharacterized protein n=1 Tax=Dryococelus australis TaxID=614101 RepID=A0ABQ9HWU7_9NEOP|nr:hypothetical protein PR048_007780 [Dryococelus australis]
MSVREPKRKRPCTGTPTEKAKPRSIPKVYYFCIVGFRNRLNTVAKILDKGDIPRERREGDRKSAKLATKKCQVKTFIGSLKGCESHYSRSKSKCVYLASNLNVPKLHKMYNRSVEHDTSLRVSFSMFRWIFVDDFNVGFRSPSSDCYTTCIRLQHQIHSAKDNTSKINILMQLRVHKLRANEFYDLAKQLPPSTYYMCFDLQHIQSLHRTPIQEAFYSRQIYFIHCAVWQWTVKHQNFIRQAGRCSTEMSSAVLHYLSHCLPDNISSVRLFCEGCGGQNKNKPAVHTLTHWLRQSASESIKNILMIFPVTGHSFLPADRVLGRVEKLLRKRPLITTKREYEAIYSSRKCACIRKRLETA